MTNGGNNDGVQAKFRGALLGTMVGDALGAPLEGWECDRVNAFLAEFPGLPRPQRETAAAIFGLITGAPVLPGSARYTDDTQMSIGVAQSLVAQGGINEPDMAARFARNFDPGRGYGLGAQVVLSALRAGAKWDEPAQKLFGGKGSWGNGAAMRAAPIGLFFHNAAPGVLRRAAEEQAAITHTHPLGKQGAVVQAAAVAVAVVTGESGSEIDPLAFLDSVRVLTGPLLPEYETGLQTVARFLDDEPDICTIADVLGNGIEAHLSVPTALFAFLANPASFENAVRYAVRLGGDADTIGAMCGAISGAFHGVEGLPPHHLTALENGPQGRDYVGCLAEELLAAWQKATLLSQTL